MYRKIAEPTRLTALILGISLCVLGCLTLYTLPEKFEDSASQAPIRSLFVTIDPSQTEEFFEKLQDFAAKNSFEYNLTDYGGQGEHFLAYILGDKIKILVVGISDNSTLFSVRFFAPSPGDPLPKEQLVDELISDLKSHLSEIENIIINED